MTAYLITFNVMEYILQNKLQLLLVIPKLKHMYNTHIHKHLFKQSKTIKNKHDLQSATLGCSKSP